MESDTTTAAVSATEHPATKMQRLARDLCAAMRDNPDAPRRVIVYADPAMVHPIAFCEDDVPSADGQGAIFSTERLRAIKPRDLHNLTDALYTVSNVLAGFLAQPRFYDEEATDYAGGGQMLDDLCELVNGAIDDIRRVSRDLKATTEHDAEFKAWVEIFGHAVWGDDLITVARSAVNGVEAVRRVKEDAEFSRLQRKGVAA